MWSMIVTNPFKPGDQLVVKDVTHGRFGLVENTVYTVKEVDALHVYFGLDSANQGRGFGYSYERFNYVKAAQPDYLDITRQVVGR